MTDEQVTYELERALEKIEILEHALGNSTHYRNHYAAGPDHKNWQHLNELVDSGYLYVGSKIPDGDMVYFHVTEKGKTLAFHGVVK